MVGKMRQLPGRCLATTFGVLVFAVAASQPASAQCQLFQTQKLLPLDGHVFHSFGTDVGVSGGVIVIGAAEINGNLPGGAYVFNFDGVVWSQSQKLLASDGEVGDRFGESVAIDDNVIVVGAYQAEVTRLPDHHEEVGSHQRRHLVCSRRHRPQRPTLRECLGQRPLDLRRDECGQRDTNLPRPDT